MSEQLKYIVQELSKEPFRRSYNLITFDSLEPLQLLQTLNDVCAEIDDKNKMDIREESSDQTAIRLFKFLRLLKYKPQSEMDMSAFCQALVLGDKPVVYAVTEWLLQRSPELRTRAYLARFLTRLDVPAEILQDDQVAELHDQYVGSMDEFKELHKEYEQLKGNAFSTADIKRDIANMEQEKDQLLKRVDKLKRKLESQPSSAPMLQVARNLRQEREKAQKIEQQKADLRNATVHGSQRLQRLQQQLRDIRQASVGATSTGLMHKLEEEAKVNEYLVNEKHPKEIEACKKYLQDLQKVASTPAMGQSDLDELNEKIAALNAEMNQLVEKRMKSMDPTDDKLTLFRQQAAIIARKKEAAAEMLNDSRTEYQKIAMELEEKKGVAQESDSGDVLKGEDFKRYVNKLRSKSTVYKKKRQEISDLRAEHGVLVRTMELLKQRDQHVNQQLAALEAKKGISGFRSTQEELEKVSTIKSELDDIKGRTLEDISEMVQKLNVKIAEKKSALAPIIKELRPMRQKHQELLSNYEEAKSRYDTAAAGYESNRAKLEQEVRSYREECSAEESRLFYLNCMKKIIDVQHHRITEEMKMYTSSDPQERKKSYREQFNRKIQEQESLGKSLREKQKTVRETHGPSMKQMKMWKDFERLMECKRRCAAGGDRQSSTSAAAAARMGFQGRQDVGEDRLVL